MRRNSHKCNLKCAALCNVLLKCTTPWSLVVCLFSVFTMLCVSYHHLIPEHFHPSVGCCGFYFQGCCSRFANNNMNAKDPRPVPRKVRVRGWGEKEVAKPAKRVGRKRRQSSQPPKGSGGDGGISGSLNFFWERLSDRAFWGFTGSAILEVIKPILGEEGL